MENIVNSWQSILAIWGPVILFLIAIFFMFKRVIAWYKKIPPSKMAVITGRNRKATAGVAKGGYRIVTGGGTIVIPMFEDMQLMDLNIITVEVEVDDVPDKDGVLVSVGMNANIKIKSDDQGAPLAIECFLGKTTEQIKAVAKNTLEGNLRNVTGRLTVEELRQDRQKFMQLVVNELGEDLGRMGLSVNGVQIQTITDKRKYFESIGLKKTAEVVRDATVGQAEATRDADKLSAEAHRIGETAKAEAALAISNANRDRDVGVAENEAQVKAKQAQIPIAAGIAAANRTADLHTAEVGALKAQAAAEIDLQEVTARRNAAALDATVVTTARKNKEAKIIEGEAEQQFATLTGEASRIKSEKEGLGQQAKDTGVAAGRIALAGANQAELVAKAEGEKAGLLAQAAGHKADLEAEGAGQVAIAAGLQAKLLAEAAGAAAMAEAWTKLDATGRVLMLMRSVGPVIDSLGIALERVAKPFAEAIGEGMGNIKEVRLIDMGGGSSGKNMLTGYAGTPVQMAYAMFQQLKATQFWPVIVGALKQAGVNVDALAAAVESNTATGTGADTTAKPVVEEEPKPAAAPAPAAHPEPVHHGEPVPPKK